MTLTTSSIRLITDLSRDALAQWCAQKGETAYRADQIRRWYFGKRVSDFDEMHDVPKPLRTSLREAFTLFSSEVVAHQTSRDGTEKLLLKLPDGNQVECVLMREEDRRTVCISTQAGCAMGCVFCASGLRGLSRNLSTGEILEQILRLDRLLDPAERITNVVVMGIGEPLANLAALLPAVDSLNDKGGLGLGARRITISTVGLPTRMRELAEHGKPFNLAVSLHAANDRLRNRLVPVNESIGIESLLAAAENYFERTGRRVTYEYVLLGGINDSTGDARQLAALLKEQQAHVNLIPFNAVSELVFRDPSRDAVRSFLEILTEAGIATTVRKRKGADIDAACGQLRLNHQVPAG